VCDIYAGDINGSAICQSGLNSPCIALQDSLRPRAPSPPGDLLLQRTLSRLAAIHLVPQGTLSSRGPSLAWRRFTLYPRAPSLAAQFTLSCYAIHLVPQGTLSCCAIHLVLLRNSPCTPGHPLLQRTLSRLAAIHLVPQGTLSSRGPSLAWRRFTLSCCAIHLVLLRNSPCKYILVCSTSASLLPRVL